MKKKRAGNLQKIYLFFKIKPDIVGAFFWLILIFSIVPRSVEILNWNPVFGFDQGREYLIVQDIVENRNLRLIGTPLGAGSAGLQGIFHGPVYYYLLAIPYVIFSGDPAGGTVFMFTIGTLSVVAAFFLGRCLFGKYGGLVFMTLVGISPLFVAQSRFLWSPYPSTLFIIIALIFTFNLRKSYKNVFFAAFFSSFIYNFELAIALPLCIAVLLYSVYVFRLKFLNYAFLFAGLILGLLPMLLFEVRHSFMAVRGILSYIISGEKNEKYNFIASLMDHLNSFGNHLVDTFLSIDIYPILLIILFLPAAFLLFKEKNKHLKEFMLFLISLPILNFVILLFLRNTVYNYYLYHLSFVYIALFTYILINIKNKLIRYGYLVFFIVILLCFFVTNTRMFLHDISDYGGTAKLKGKVDAIDYIYNDAKGEQFGLFVFSPPVYTYPYDYIISWKQKKEYGYMPGQDKKGLFYLLIEKDSEKPWSYEGWIQTVIKTGRLEKEVVLPSGFIIQKRIGE